MLAPKLCCGLGNRLFQTMAAIGEAERTNAKPVFFLPRTSQEHGDFELIFKLFPTLEILETAPTWKEIEESHTSSREPLTVLSGFFQDTKFFPTMENPHWPRLPVLAQPQDSWAIHFRFGDYQILEHYHVDLSRYYFHTITKIPKGSHVTLFSDSPERLPPIAKEIESLGYNVRIFNGDPFETLKAFSACVKGICSNSTFAWWAAYFAWKANPHFTAYFPNRWLTTEPPLNLFNLPFTQSIDLDSINAEPALLSFSHS